MTPSQAASRSSIGLDRAVNIAQLIVIIVGFSGGFMLIGQKEEQLSRAQRDLEKLNDIAQALVRVSIENTTKIEQMRIDMDARAADRYTATDARRDLEEIRRRLDRLENRQ